MPYLEAVLVGGWQDEGWGGEKGDHAYGWLEGVSERAWACRPTDEQRFQTICRTYSILI